MAVTSASSGTRRRVTRPPVRRAAGSMARQAFLAPAMGTRPRSGWPPSISMRSMAPPRARAGQRPPAPGATRDHALSPAASRARACCLRRRRFARSAAARRCSRSPAPARGGAPPGRSGAPAPGRRAESRCRVTPASPCRSSRIRTHPNLAAEYTVGARAGRGRRPQAASGRGGRWRRQSGDRRAGAPLPCPGPPPRSRGGDGTGEPRAATGRHAAGRPARRQRSPGHDRFPTRPDPAGRLPAAGIPDHRHGTGLPAGRGRDAGPRPPPGGAE